MTTTLKTPFEINAGDRILATDGRVFLVRAARDRATSIGQALALRHESAAPAPGDGYAISYERPDGAVSGISGRWDGESRFRVIE